MLEDVRLVGAVLVRDGASCSDAAALGSGRKLRAKARPNLSTYRRTAQRVSEPLSLALGRPKPPPSKHGSRSSSSEGLSESSTLFT